METAQDIAPGVMGRRAWEWMLRHADDFFIVGSDAAAERQRLKCVSELALIAGTLTSTMPEARALLDRAWDELDRGAQLARSLHTWPIVATAYLPFHMAGHRSRELEQHLADLSWLREHARFPAFVRFAIGVTLYSIGVPPPWNEAEVVLANRFFDRPTAKTPAIRAELLAHAIMWRSEMGRNPAGLSTAAVRMYRVVSAAWHPILQQSQLLDPLGEMVIADVCSGGRAPSQSLALLCASQRADGAMPCKPGDPADSFLDLYHTTCVAALAGMLTDGTRAARDES